MSETTRIAALKASLEMRTIASTTDEILERASIFDAFLTEQHRPPAKEPEGEETPSGGTRPDNAPPAAEESADSSKTGNAGHARRRAPVARG